MTWLDGYANKFAKEEAEKKAREDEKMKFMHSWNEDIRKEKEEFMDNKLAPLVGRKTKDGRTISLNKENWELKADGQPLLRLGFWLGEHEDYDRDGCRWGNGSYYVNKHVIYFVKHKSRYGDERGGPEQPKFESFYEEDVAFYLLQVLA